MEPLRMTVAITYLLTLIIVILVGKPHRSYEHLTRGRVVNVHAKVSHSAPVIIKRVLHLNLVLKN